MGEGDAYFTKGMEVEVCSDDVGLRGAWFVATVLRSPSKKNKVLVEYHTLMADEKGSRPLREFVDVVNLRPIPPRELDRSFETSDEVDAYLNDGWWEGVVITVLDNSRYSVYFRPGKEELEFEQSELRIHREWVKGLWVPPMEEAHQSEQDQQQQAETQNADTVNNHGNVKSDEAGLLPVDNTADIANEFNSEKLKIAQQISSSSMAQILPPCTNPKQGQTSQGAFFLGAQHEEMLHSFPTSKKEAATVNKKGLCQNLVKNFPSPSEMLSNHLAGKGEKGPPMKEPGQNLGDILSTPAEQFLPDFAQAKIGRVLDCGRVDDQTVEYLPPLSNNEEEKCDLSKTMVTSPTTKEEEVLQNKKQHCQYSIDNFSSFEGLNGHLATKGEENPPEKKDPSRNLTDGLSGPSEGFSNEPNYGQEKIESGLDCERSVHQTVEGLSPLSSNEGEKSDSSKPMATSPTIKEEDAAPQKKTELCQTLTDNFSSPFEELSNQLARKGEETFENKEPSNAMSSSSEGLSICLVPNCGQEQTESVLKYDCSSHPVVGDSSAFSNTGENCVSPTAMTTSPTTKEAVTLKNMKDPSLYSTNNFSKGEENPPEKKEPSRNLTDVLSGPSEGFSDEPNIGQEKIESGLDCERSVHQTVEGLSPLSINEGEKSDLSKPMATSPTIKEKEEALQKKTELCQMLTDNFPSPFEEFSNQLARKGEETFEKKEPSNVVSSPSEGLSICLVPNCGQEQIESVLNYDCSSHPVVEDLSAFSNTGEKCASPKAMTTSPTTKEAATLKNKKDPSICLNCNFSSPLEGLSDHYAPKKEEASPQKKVPSQNSGDIFSSPSKVLSNQLEPSLGQEKFGAVLDCNRSSHPTVQGLSPFANYKGENCDLSKAMSTTSSTTKVETPPAEKTEESQSLTDIFSSPLAGLSNQHSAKEEEASLPKKKGLTQNLNDIFSSPSEEGSNHLATNFVQEKSGSVFTNESCGCHQTVENISMSPLSNQNGEQCDSSTIPVGCSEKNIAVQVPPNSINRPDQQQCEQMEIECCCTDLASNGKNYCEKHVLEQNIHNEQRRKRPREASHIIMEPFIPSEHQQQCRRTGKGWRCSKLASPWKRYCDRHEEAQNIRNGKRRKKPVEQNQFIMEPFLPSENLQCRRTGKGWRCSGMASTGKRYCGKHQLEQDTYNEKRRNTARERRCLATSGTDEKSNFDDTQFESSEHQQCDPEDMDLKSNEGETGIAADQGHLSQTVNESDKGKTRVEAFYDEFWSLYIT